MSLPIWLCDKTFACYARGVEDRSLIPRAGRINIFVIISDWPTLVSSVCYASLVSASVDRDFKPGSKYSGLQYSPAQKRDITQQGFYYTTISLPRWRHIHGQLSGSIGQPRKITFTDTHNN